MGDDEREQVAEELREAALQYMNANDETIIVGVDPVGSQYEFTVETENDERYVVSVRREE